MKTLIWY